MNKPQYDLFLSYNSADRAEVTQFRLNYGSFPSRLIPSSTGKP